jgi:hypothetical protein
MKAFESITSDGSSVITLNPEVHGGMCSTALVWVESGSLRYRVDGSDPDNGIEISTYVKLTSLNEINLFMGRGSCVLKVDYC